MTLSTDSFAAAAAEVCARNGADVAGMPALELLDLSRDVAAAHRQAEVLLAQVAGEIARRSAPADAGAGMAARHGFRSAEELVASVTGGAVAHARRLVTVGELLAGVPVAGAPSAGTDDGAAGDRGGDTAEPAGGAIDAFRAELARAVESGLVGADVTALFSDALAGLPDEQRTRMLFEDALSKSPGLPLHRVRKLVWWAQAESDPAAWEQREERQHEQRSVSISDSADGMVTLTARLTPLAAAPVRAVLDAGVRFAMQQRRDDPAADLRTPWQMRADVLVGLCSHALDCERTTSGVKTTVVVRMTAQELRSGLGLGEVDGAPQPVSANALRNAAADAEVIPAVLGGKSQVLDWGRAKRLFSASARLALAERDGGCAKCHAPPSRCEAHHIRWWDRHGGPTDLENGVLLCSRCHHMVHRDGWDIEVREHAVYFIPPRGVDPTRTPQIGGRARFEVAA